MAVTEQQARELITIFRQALIPGERDKPASLELIAMLLGGNGDSYLSEIGAQLERVNENLERLADALEAKR